MILTGETETNQFGYSWVGVPCVFTDGGLMSSNPSTVGGTWAWVRINEEGDVTDCKSGVLLPHHLQLTTVTNNQSEMTAIYKALKGIPSGWKGRLYSDSQICLTWIQSKKKWKNCPEWLESMVKTEIQRIHNSGGCVYFRHLDGHQEGSHFHQWNCRCDQMCNEQRTLYEERNGIESRRPKPKRSKGSGSVPGKGAEEG